MESGGIIKLSNGLFFEEEYNKLYETYDVVVRDNNNKDVLFAKEFLSREEVSSIMAIASETPEKLNQIFWGF